ncbi:MAG TPA: S8 family serine peptidase [Longimicrobium sp.]|nr:S8 family serine peptidase [Longimicrobium sp.]
MRISPTLLLCAAVLFAGGCAEQAPLATPAPPLEAAAARAAPVIAGAYVVVTAPEADPAAVAASLGVAPAHVYRAALRGFAARMGPGQLRAARAHPAVRHVEADQVVFKQATYVSPPWGLDRIDERALPLDGRLAIPDFTGAVNVYVIDAGLQPEHPEFAGNAQNVWDVFGGAGRDCNGHGVAVAGTIGSTTYGVGGTKSVAGTVGGTPISLKGVKVLDCNGRGTVSGFIAAVDWVRVHAQRPAVVSLAVITGYSSALNAAVDNLALSGVFVAVPAGDSGADACNASPASAAEAFTVAASDRSDARWASSGFGACVDGYAPGVAVPTVGLNGGTQSVTGTSMSAAHVAGVAALYKSRYGETSSRAIDSWIKTWSTPGVVTGSPRLTPNRLLYVGMDSWI